MPGLSGLLTQSPLAPGPCQPWLGTLTGFPFPLHSATQLLGLVAVSHAELTEHFSGFISFLLGVGCGRKLEVHRLLVSEEQSPRDSVPRHKPWTAAGLSWEMETRSLLIRVPGT